MPNYKTIHIQNKSQVVPYDLRPFVIFVASLDVDYIRNDRMLTYKKLWKPLVKGPNVLPSM